MTWEIVWTQRATHDLRSMDRAAASRIVTAVERFAQTGYGDVARIKAQRSEFRLRVGDRRVRFTYDLERRMLLVLRVLHRREAYRS